MARKLISLILGILALAAALTAVNSVEAFVDPYAVPIFVGLLSLAGLLALYLVADLTGGLASITRAWRRFRNPGPPPFVLELSTVDGIELIEKRLLHEAALAVPSPPMKTILIEWRALAHPEGLQMQFWYAPGDRPGVTSLRIRLDGAVHRASSRVLDRASGHIVGQEFGVSEIDDGEVAIRFSVPQLLSSRVLELDFASRTGLALCAEKPPEVAWWTV